MNTELTNQGATASESNPIIVTFEKSKRQYTIDQNGTIKEKKLNPNVVEISELNENANLYFGWDVINYAETLAEGLQDIEWQLFYAGALDGETEERIYLISKDYIKNTVLPAKNGAAPIPVSGSNYKAKFGKNTNNTGIMSQYSGSSNISSNMYKYNSDYFKNYNSTNPNMKAVAYMLDTNIWSPFATSSHDYAEFAIGGPTVELLFTAYNKYTENTQNPTAYEADAVSNIGYLVRKTSEDTFETAIRDAIANDAIPYTVNGNSNASGYNLASPSNYIDDGVMGVYSSGIVNYGNCDGYVTSGFRPLVLLNSKFTLEKTKDINEKDAFKIVEK